MDHNAFILILVTWSGVFNPHPSTDPRELGLTVVDIQTERFDTREACERAGFHTVTATMSNTYLCEPAYVFQNN